MPRSREREKIPAAGNAKQVHLVHKHISYLKNLLTRSSVGLQRSWQQLSIKFAAPTLSIMPSAFFKDGNRKRKNGKKKRKNGKKKKHRFSANPTKRYTSLYFNNSHGAVREPLVFMIFLTLRPIFLCMGVKCCDISCFDVFAWRTD